MPATLMDSRGFFMLPQSPEQAGYYTYGTPGNGAGQFAHPSLISMLCQVERRWNQIDERKFGVGNISKHGGVPYPGHLSHRKGTEVDIRLIRKDGKEARVTRFDPAYDRDATKKLIGLLWETGAVRVILFNDSSIPKVKPWLNHDDHLHVSITV